MFGDFILVKHKNKMFILKSSYDYLNTLNYEYMRPSTVTTPHNSMVKLKVKQTLNKWFSKMVSYILCSSHHTDRMFKYFICYLRIWFVKKSWLTIMTDSWCTVWPCWIHLYLQSVDGTHKHRNVLVTYTMQYSPQETILNKYSNVKKINRFTVIFSHT